MANEKNLIPLNKRSKEEAKKIQKQGGDARGKQRTQNKTFQELTQQMLNMEVSDDNIKKIVKLLFPNLKDKEITAKTVMLARQYEKAIKKGDSKAFEVLRDTAGEKPIDKSEVVTTEKPYVASLEEKEEIERIKKLSGVENE